MDDFKEQLSDIVEDACENCGGKKKLALGVGLSAGVLLGGFLAAKKLGFLGDD